ncbi:hypothetical protein SL1157_1656 [Ruegeria lacuscaerulensis ITI-1157]|nr:hypothetical protein SL1157_1656 [Ruegeria lacuscaerulensis ITI-1157]
MVVQMSMEPNFDILPAVRSQIEQAEEKLQVACRLLRENGWPENSDELVRSLKHVRVWTQRDGWLDILARQDARFIWDCRAERRSK